MSLKLFIKNLFLRWDDAFYAGGVCIAISGFIAYIMGSVHAEDRNNDDDSSSEDEQDLKCSRNGIA